MIGGSTQLNHCKQTAFLCLSDDLTIYHFLWLYVAKPAMIGRNFKQYFNGYFQRWIGKTTYCHFNSIEQTIKKENLHFCKLFGYCMMWNACLQFKTWSNSHIIGKQANRLKSHHALDNSLFCTTFLFRHLIKKKERLNVILCLNLFITLNFCLKNEIHPNTVCV